MMTDFCGGFTMFSTFSLQTLDLIQKHEWPKAGINIAATVILCIACIWLGWIIAQVFKKSPA